MREGEAVMKRIIVLFLMCLLLLPTNLLVSATPVTGNQEDLTLTINYFSGHDEPVVGATLKLYQIAAMDDSYNITADSRFARFREQLEGKDTQWDILALTLRQYIMENEITCDDEDTVDTSGQVHFPASNDIMSPGIYLVCGPRYRTEEKIYN